MFDGHHRVGWNSYPNVMAILTGVAAYKTETKPDTGVFYIDEEFQFIQNVFRDHGYLRSLPLNKNILTTLMKYFQLLLWKYFSQIASGGFTPVSRLL